MRLQIVIALVLIGIGVTGGFYLALYIQNQLQVLVAVAIIIAFLTWFGSGADLLGLLRDWYRDKQAEKSKPSFRIEVNEPNEPSRVHTRLLTFKIWNKGGGQSAINPTVVCKVEGQNEEYAVKWHQASIPIPDDIPSPEIIQSWLDDNRWFTTSKIDHEGYETIELLVTTDHHNLAYFLDSNKTKLELGKHYNITLKVKATDVQAHIRKFDINLTRWDTVNATEIA